MRHRVAAVMFLVGLAMVTTATSPALAFIGLAIELVAAVFLLQELFGWLRRRFGAQTEQSKLWTPRRGWQNHQFKKRHKRIRREWHSLQKKPPLRIRLLDGIARIWGPPQE